MRKKRQVKLTITNEAFDWWFSLPKGKRSKTLDNIIKDLVVPVSSNLDASGSQEPLTWLSVYSANQDEMYKILSKIFKELRQIDTRLGRFGL